MKCLLQNYNIKDEVDLRAAISAFLIRLRAIVAFLAAINDFTVADISIVIDHPNNPNKGSDIPIVPPLVSVTSALKSTESQAIALFSKLWSIVSVKPNACFSDAEIFEKSSFSSLAISEAFTLH